ncbi:MULTISPECIES: bifunctional 3-(3-hydroxy-phenyl)propionate/3-hydroxycinnamic acid hydroxylase [Burkholderia cepacia complex]|uniref:bifunctional 3-(3-hydroxy-phenyl)propionate/3-hydroxycinnamic acid hydroxylase n=1 Tax=Burkholderia cepacia complex TaxID=87882 RepID=UPI000F5B8037|nr:MULTISPECIES: bifunctional 3-(3-hydroxy-phenyl)propionate/3-hydroxycinnamic acid hydroxylase [Burkholderia cepacia complex]MBY4798864.1 bifunctional 3-(3-hydroxy-phenyl)propionate/3-hydroxycinnamic acid hydroxylase [Burkholderia cepacia]MDA3672157.1 bifunctional 3-(3-hydroxy-phenyl)propionate/3-hydroxycinnamic acid hydroxylase [Burkholderia cenocepacia]MDA3681488.1 bifunctional 3-(3-hydroxy-phenyl)propionate/3-hydroxycinnamic acid hydroxylase [Burkholderia cenocepacia]MDA3689101.1 bifunction
MKANNPERTSVAIVGAGPNGVAMANLLGLYGIATVIVEKAADVVEFPRAVGIDDEALRMFQTAGLADELSRDIIQNVPLRMFKANGECFADIRPSIREFGWWRRNIFMQQLAERTLRTGLARYPHVSLRTSEEVVDVEQDDGGVTLQVRRADGRQYALQADYVVAADGGRSPMRELLGVTLAGTTHPIKWVVVDVKNAGLDQPCTALNCDPRRPNVCIYLPFDFRRWEFLVFPHEDEAAIAQPDSIRALIAPYVDDIDRVEIVRARTYTHHSRVAERFVVGRVAFVGDAAHLSPPWIGQGLNAGLRDVGNLAWKLAGIVRGALHPGVISTYESERRDHAKAMIDLADTFGAMLMPTNRLVAFVRDRVLGLVRFAPGLKDYILQMRFKPMPSYTRGIVLPGGSDAVGRMIVQPDVETADGVRRKLDDVLGPWFSIVGWQCDPQACLSDDDRAYWTSLGAAFVQVSRSRSGTSRARRVTSVHGSACVEDVDNALAAWFDRHAGPLVVVRPDRYVAAQTDAVGMARATAAFQAFAPRQREEAHVC